MENNGEEREGDEGVEEVEENRVGENEEGNDLSNGIQHGSGAVGSTTGTGEERVIDPFCHPGGCGTIAIGGGWTAR